MAGHLEHTDHLVFIIGTGPSEVHAHIDLDQHLDQLGLQDVTVIATAEHGGHWSVIALDNSGAST